MNEALSEPSTGRFCTCRETPFNAEPILDLADDSVSAQPVVDASSTSASDSEPRSIADLSPGEVSICLEKLGGAELELTNRRIILRGEARSSVIFSSMRIDQVDSISVLLVPHSRRILYWGVVGILATIGIWQSLDGTGNIRLAMSAIVATASIALIIAHIILPPNVRLLFTSSVGSELAADFAYEEIDKADKIAVLVWSHIESRVESDRPGTNEAG